LPMATVAPVHMTLQPASNQWECFAGSGWPVRGGGRVDVTCS